MKKLLSAIIAVSLVLTSSISSFAAANSNKSSSAVNPHNYTLVKSLTIKSNSLLLYPYNLESDNKAFVVLRDDTKNTTDIYSFKDSYKAPKTISIKSSDTFTPLFGVSNGSGGGGSFNYVNTDGIYDVLKIKLSDFSEYFKSNGTHDQYCSTLKANHNYNFKKQVTKDNDVFHSALFFESGAAITCATPDANGEVEIVVSRNPAHIATFSTEFACEIRSLGGLTTSTGGGKNRQSLPGLRMGDTDCDGYTDIYDVTEMQKLLSDSISFNKLQKRNGDFDKDGKITINDVTILQRYLAEFNISKYYKTKLSPL